MARLTTVKPRVAFARQRIVSHYVERIRGRANQVRRERILSARPCCAECARQGRIFPAAEVDHVVPLWAGGSDDDANLEGLCVPCHRAKSAREAADRASGAGGG